MALSRRRGDDVAQPPQPRAAAMSFSSGAAVASAAEVSDEGGLGCCDSRYQLRPCVRHLCLALLGGGLLAHLLFPRVGVLARHHREMWGKWHRMASRTDTVRALLLGGSAGHPDQLVESARLELWRKAAKRTQFRCWDHRQRGSAQPRGSSSQRRRRRLRHLPPCKPTATRSCGLQHGQLEQLQRLRRERASALAGFEPNASVLLQPHDLIPPGRSISVVGNGDATNMSRATIEAADVIVRFNDFVLAPRLTGVRTDVHVMNGNVRGNTSCRADINIVIECKRRVPTPPAECLARRRLACVVTAEAWHFLCRGHEAGADPTRGFLVLAMFRRQARHMRLFGFHGEGHWYDQPDAAMRVAKSKALVLNPETRGRWAPAHAFHVEHKMLHGEHAHQMATVVR